MSRRCARRALPVAEAGFTILEMLVVLVILAMTAALAVPLLRGPPAKLRIAAAVQEIAGALQLTRAAAIARDEDMAFVVDAAQRSYSSPAVQPRMLPADATLELKEAPLQPTAYSPRDAIRFFPDGSSTGGSIVVRAAAEQTRITVDWLSGRTWIEP